MNIKTNLIKKVLFIFLAFVSVFGIVFSNINSTDAANGATEYLKKGDGSYLTYRGSSEKVLTLKEYNNPIQQYRAVWVSHFVADVSSYRDETSYKQEVNALLDNMESMGMNAMVFHIRTHNNAMYNSKLNPRAIWWKNVNFDEFDPLEWIIEECHSRGIEFHAWMNPYRISDSHVVGDYPEGNPALKPELLLSNGSGTILDPGSQEVRDFIVDTCMEVIENYDVDAIHFDDYFYISGVETNKSADWKRAQVDAFIEQLHNEMTEHNEKYGKNVQLGISPSGIYRNGSYVASPSYDENGNLLSPLGSYTSGFAHYGDYLYSDTLHWINEGWIDYITPQTYWGLEHNVASYAALSRWWSWATTYKDVNLYLGMGIYMAIDGSGYWNKDTNEVEKQLLNSGMYEEIDGICVYKYESLLSSNTTVKKGVQTFKNYWGQKRVPSAVQKSYADKVPSYPVTNLCVVGNEIVWDAVDNVRGYMVYKVPTGDILDKNNLDHLVIYTQSTSFAVNDTAVYDYYVATVNRANVIGEPIKLSTGSSLEPYEVVINRINSLPTNITLQHENQVNNVLKLYDNLTNQQKTLVTNYSTLEKAVQVIKDIKEVGQKVQEYVNNLPKDLTDGLVLTPPENMRWSYKNASDATIYNIVTGDKHGTYLGKKVTLTLTANVPNTTITHSVDVEFNASVISSDYIPLIYRDDASCMTPDDTGEYGPDNSKYIGWSNYILYIGKYALPLAKGNYFEITDASKLSIVNWTSCAGVFVNKTGQTLNLNLNDVFASETPSYGHLIIDANNKVKSSSNETSYGSTYTLAPNETIVVTRYLERIIANTPFTDIEVFTVGTSAIIEKYEETANVNRVESVILVIEQLPTNITLKDENIINEALVFYNSLNDSEKALVTNYSKLAGAIQTLNKLVEEHAKLEKEKISAINTMNNYVNLNNYSTVNQSSIKGYINIYKAELTNATTIAEVKEIVNRFKISVDGIQTIAQELVSKKEVAKKELNAFVSLENYSEKQQENIKKILATIEERVNATITFDELNETIAAIQSELSEIMTLGEELVYLRDLYRDEIFTYYNESEYASEVGSRISAEAINVSLELVNAKTIDEIYEKVDEFKTFINNFIKKQNLQNVQTTAITELQNKVSEPYSGDERVITLVETTKEKIGSITTYSELETINAEFAERYESLKAVIDAENVPADNGKRGCFKSSALVISLTTSLSLVVLVLRKKK